MLVMAPVPKAFEEWTEIDVAVHELGLLIGLIPSEWSEARRIVETDNPVLKGLISALLNLVVAGLLEANFIVEDDGSWNLIDRDAHDYAFRGTSALPTKK
jgi:hypothetical protein